MSSSLPHEPSGTRPLVLVVDDDEGIREFITEVLVEEGYAVVTAAHGAAALDLLGQHSPSLILLDMKMPVMDGWEFARRYHERPAPHAPVVVITAAQDARQRAADINASAVIGKPFDLSDLIDTVEAQIARDC
jgi:two-component system, chemotaxis family, chemotaxis protein CheY